MVRPGLQEISETIGVCSLAAVSSESKNPGDSCFDELRRCQDITLTRIILRDLLRN